LGYSPNLLLELKEPDGINQVWVGDITYIPLVDRSFLYLSILMDRYSRAVVGWDISSDMTVALVCSSLRLAIKDRQPNPNLVHHTDRGGQYAAHRYRDILRRARMKQSMSRAGDCYDNAFMESCFGTIKTELEMTEYQNKMDAANEVREYLAYYNLQRKHSSLGYLTPAQFEELTD
jgi:transposase InsO family protein